MKGSVAGLFDLAGRRAVVTGGGNGLGAGIAAALAVAGARVLVIDINPQIREQAGVMHLQADLGDLESLPQVFEKALGLLGGADVLVNNAGVLTRCAAENLALDQWQRVLRLNLDAVFRLCQLAGNAMLAQGSGKIINMASMLSYMGGLSVSSYAASKGGVAQLTKALSNEWAGRGVTVNAIAPGYMDTSINTSLIADKARAGEVLARIPMKRWGTPEDLAGTAVFLASRASDYITGAIIPVDGGYLSR